MASTVSAGDNLRAALAAAVREVNFAFVRLPVDRRPDPSSHDAFDQELDAAYLSGDPGRAAAALDSWRSHWLMTFEEVA